MKPIEDHKDLAAWRKAVSLAAKVYGTTRSLPAEEREGLNSQLRRAAVSIPTSIAEGAARQTRSEFLQFLHQARGSLSELETQLMIAVEENLIRDDRSIMSDVAEVGRLLHELSRSLASSAREAHARACSPQNGAAMLQRSAPQVGQ